jgi:hypothetical protein
MSHPLSSRSLTISLAILLALVSAMPVAGSVDREADSQLDLSAMALRTNDFLDEGKDGFGQSYGHLTDRHRSASDFLRSAGLDAGNADEDVVAGARAERTYILQHNRFNGVGFSQAAFSIVLEFEDDDEAEDALDGMEDQWLEAGLLNDVRRAERIGGDSFYLEGEAITQNPEVRVERTTLAFRVERIVAAVIIINFNDDDPPTQEVTENLALRQADRIEAVLDGDEGGNLSQKALRLRTDGSNAWMDSYLAIDGEWQCEDFDFLTPNACDERQDTANQHGIENAYSLKTRIAGNFHSQGTPEVWLWVFLREYSNDEVAESALERLHSAQSDDGVMEEIKLGDEAFTTFGPSNDNLMYSVFVRVGDTVAIIIHDTGTGLAAEQGWNLEPSESATLELAKKQVACLEGAESCTKTVRIPREMIPEELKNVAVPSDLASFDTISGRRHP